MEYSRIRRMVAWLLATLVVLSGLCDCGHSQDEGSGSSPLPAVHEKRCLPSDNSITMTANCGKNLNTKQNNALKSFCNKLVTDCSHDSCYLVTEEMPNFVSSVCANFTAHGKLYLHNYGADPNTIHRDLMVFEAFFEGQNNPEYCLDVIRAYGCNVIYPGCNPITGQPQGVCESDCVTFAQGSCGSLIQSAVDLSATSDVPLAFNCSHTLAQFPPDFLYNKSDCWSIADLIVMPTPSPTPTPALITSVSTVTVAVMALLVGVICLCTVRHVRKKRQRRKLLFIQAHSVPHTPNSYHTNPLTLEDLLHDPNESLYVEVADGNFQLRAEDVDSITMDLRSTLIPFDHLELIGDLGEGNFGRVYKALLTKANDSGFTELVPVAVKTIKNRGSYAAMKGMLMESALMRSFDHPHVMSLIGITLNPHQRCPYLILPFMEHGDLRTFLKSKRDVATRSSESDFPEGLNYTILMRMCYQIASGMEHIASKRLVHRDLAARNCMIDIRMRVKVADFGLTRDIYQTDYYRQQHAGHIPVKWMAPESLLDRISNEKTDMWSFGVTCWEVFSLGRAPYPSLANHEMIEYLEQGHRLKKPTLCKEYMYTLISQCWIESPTGRPTFSTLVNKFTKLMPEERVIGEAISNDNLNRTSPEQMKRMETTENEVTASSAALVDEHDHDTVIYNSYISSEENLLGEILTHLAQSPAQSFPNAKGHFLNAGHHGDEYIQMNPVGSLPASFMTQVGHHNRSPDEVFDVSSNTRSLSPALVIENPRSSGYNSDEHSESTGPDHDFDTAPFDERKNKRRNTSSSSDYVSMNPTSPKT